MKRLTAFLFIVIYAALTFNSAMAFSDMDDNEDTLLLERLEVISGYEDGTLRPWNNVTRAEAITTLIRAFDIRSEFALYEYENMARTGLYRGDVIASDFDDYDPYHWANAYIQAGINEGMISGFEDNTFRPSDNVTIEQLFVMALGAVGYGDAAEKAGGYPSGYVDYAVRTGIANNISGPDYGRAATRFEVMTCAANMLRADIYGSNLSLLENDGYIYEAEATVNSVGAANFRGEREVDITITNADNYAGITVTSASPLNTLITLSDSFGLDIEEGKKYKMYINCYNEDIQNAYLMIAVPKN